MRKTATILYILSFIYGIAVLIPGILFTTAFASIDAEEVKAQVGDQIDPDLLIQALKTLPLTFSSTLIVSAIVSILFGLLGFIFSLAKKKMPKFGIATTIVGTVGLSPLLIVSGIFDFVDASPKAIGQN